MLAQGRMPLGYLMQAPWAPVVDGYFLRGECITYNKLSKRLPGGRFRPVNIFFITANIGMQLLMEIKSNVA